VPASDTAPERAGAQPKTRRPAAKGFRPFEIALVAGAIALVAWGAWVTKSIAGGGVQQEFVQLQLQGIIGEYLQAQARSGSDEETAARETAVFMAKLDEKVAALGRQGKVVLVHEAVIGGEIPDVTDAVKSQLYAEVPRPKMLPAGGVQGDMEAYLSANGGGDGR
jgi:hypothetical protein